MPLILAPADYGEQQKDHGIGADAQALICIAHRAED
jgi:hypothetical protein